MFCSGKMGLKPEASHPACPPKPGCHPVHPPWEVVGMGMDPWWEEGLGWGIPVVPK